MIFVVHNKWLIDAMEAIEGQEICEKNFMKQFYLRDFFAANSSEGSIGEPFDLDLEKLENDITDLLRDLKSYAEWSDLADYYISLQYIFSSPNKEFTNEMNRAIGLEMFRVAIRMGNKYAKNLIAQGLKIFREKFQKST